VACRCYGPKWEIAYVGRRHEDSLAEAVASCAPLLADASVGARHLSRRMAQMMTPSANASGGCSQTADTDTGGLAGPPL
jgi:hypothetical protein